MFEEKVSIITPMFNSGKFISQTIESVLSQTYENWEMIIVDDNSTDNGCDIVELYVSKEPRIKLFKNTSNSGAAVCRNKAIELASGRFIAFLDSDDQWLPKKLAVQIEFMQVNNVAFSFTSYRKIDENNDLIGEHRVTKNVSYGDLLKTCSIGCLTVVYDTEYLGKVYMPLIRKRQDFALWLKLLRKTAYAFALSDVLAEYRIRSGSVSSNKWKVLKYQWQVYRNLEKLSLIKSVYFFSWYSFYGIKNRFFSRFC